jgi:geranylgeranyl diphosphate synthase, type II
MTAPTMSEPIADPFSFAARIDGFLRAFVESRGLPVSLREAVLYSLLGPGKRLRPILAWHCCSAVGGTPENHWGVAAALELVHCFSLVHDDLPAMDDDDLRRGRPTLHKHTNEAMAVLAGDEMLTLAFQAIIETESNHPQLSSLISELSRSTSDMIVGQVHDTLGWSSEDLKDQPTAVDRVRHIHAHKTGALIRAACRMGAIAGEPNAHPDHLRAITDYANAIGLMFQIVDDLIDVTQTTEHVGKRTNKDADAGKLTYPSVHGLDASREMVARLQDEALGALRPLGIAADPLRLICVQMATRTK